MLLCSTNFPLVHKCFVLSVLYIAKSVGPVVGLKMMFDKETGKSKGYAFVEYPDVETASSAVRNLNNYTIGNRQLKCDFSWETSMNTVGSMNSRGKMDDALPPLPAGRSLDSNETYQSAITSAVGQLDDARRQQVIADAIKMTKRNSLLMDELLAQCPQLAYALVEIMLTTKKVDEHAIQSILLNNVTSDTTQYSETTKTTPPALGADEIEMIKQVVQLSDDIVAGLPEDQRAQILEIKENYKNGVYGSL
ncbi:CYFA0S01e04478g1_1 [Cyberlindnera fabianii]|uniref:CYFA0S01e04478g1_1 n=1 Tax=Cyberlindnera fabianii TaxID=36022 RepID=A0A061AGS5_CYBFA|nr:CYFA0S01e04478g1_1 [Cyberlindnera fabianii]